MSRRAPAFTPFDRGHRPAVQAAGDGLEGAYSAILNTAPSGGTVKVIVPNLWGLTTVRTAVCSLAFTGTPGDRVLVVFDEEKQPWVVQDLSGPPALTWTAPTLINSWVLDGTAGNTPAGYLKDRFGFVHLRGRIKSGASGAIALVLPAGSRPVGADNYPAAAQLGGVGVAGFVVVDATGNVEPLYASSITNISLAGIHFLAEN